MYDNCTGGRLRIFCGRMIILSSLFLNNSCCYVNYLIMNTIIIYLDFNNQSMQQYFSKRWGLICHGLCMHGDINSIYTLYVAMYTCLLVYLYFEIEIDTRIISS